MLRWLLRLLRPVRKGTAVTAQQGLSMPGKRAGRRRISTTAGEFDAHLAKRRT